MNITVKRTVLLQLTPQRWKQLCQTCYVLKKQLQASGVDQFEIDGEVLTKKQIIELFDYIQNHEQTIHDKLTESP